MNVIGPQLRKHRKSQDLTLEELSLTCNLNGLNISKAVLSRIEKQQRKITDMEIVQFAKILDIPIQQLFDIE